MNLAAFRWTLVLAFCLALGTTLFSQNSIAVSGTVFDAESTEPLSFVSVSLLGQNIGVYTEDDGSFSFNINRSVLDDNPRIRISSVGFVEQILPLDVSKNEVNFSVALQQESRSLGEVVIQEKKYRNKNNPAVELIREVVKNRDENRVKNFDSYRVEQYEKVLMGFSNLSEKFRNRRILRSWKFALDNIDTTKMDGLGVTPIYLQESLQDFYTQNNPNRSKTLVNTTKKVRFPLLDDEGLDKYVRHLYQDVDLYENSVRMFTDDFLSPIANNAWLFYRYYPSDTLEINDVKVVKLQFFPRNKMDKLFQGDLYITLDSTYALVKAEFTVNPEINLNWVRTFEAEQIFKKLDGSRRWALKEESYVMDFGMFRKGSGIFGERFVSHKNPELGATLPDSVFVNQYEKRTVLDNAEENALARLEANRHVALNEVEAKTYMVIDSLQKTKLFQRTTKLIHGLVIGFWKPTPGIEIGRLNTIYSFNPVEGTRLRFGGRTNPLFSKRVNIEGYGAYGVSDKRWKMGIAANISLSKRPYNRFPYNLFRISYISDLKTPGVIPIGTFDPTSLATSFVRGTNDRFLFRKRFYTQYEHEFRNKFAITGGFEHVRFSPLGSLSFNYVGDVSGAAPQEITAAHPFINLRFAPGEEFYETNHSWRQRVRFKAIFTLRYERSMPNIFGSDYRYDSWHASVYKLFKFGILGRNYFFVEGGWFDGEVPYPLLKVHRANQTFGYRFMSYNLMNFMEFVSDRYVAVHTEQQFGGFFLNKVPLVKKLKFREYLTFKMIYGQVSADNTPSPNNDLLELPKYDDGTPLTYTLENKPYIEASFGIGNIFKLLRVDYVRRYTFLDHPFVDKWGIRIAAHAAF